MALVILPDTNSLLHFKRPDQIDWAVVAARPDVEIVLTTVPIREIDKHANYHAIGRLRDRARNLKSWIRTLLGNGPTATIRVDAREPTGFLTNGLDPDIADDRLLATALMLMSEGAEVAIYTDDTLLQAKAPAFTVATIWPREDDRLKDEPDPLAAENARIRRELDGIKARRPVLSLEWADGETVLELPVFPPDMDEVLSPEQELERLVPMAEPSSPSNSAVRRSGDLAHLAGLSGPSLAAVQRYNSELESYHRKYRAYYQKLEGFETVRGRLGLLAFKARNNGTAVATSFRALVTLPASLKLLEDEDAIGEVPKPPREPRRPVRFDLTHGLYEESLAPRDWASMITPQVGSWDDSPYLNLDHNSLELRRSKLPQHLEFSFDPALVLISPDLDGATATVEIRITAEELLQPEFATLPFRVVPQ